MAGKNKHLAEERENVREWSSIKIPDENGLDRHG